MTHPYSDLAPSHFWTNSVAEKAPHQIDPVTASGFRISRNDQVSTMGSCFAQHISNGLRRRSMNYLVTEPGPAALSSAKQLEAGYGIYTARFGNLYSIPQATQLVDRAFGRWESTEPAWSLQGRWVDPLRPRAQPGGFTTPEEVERDRLTHLAAVRQMFLASDFLIFTLGLTEMWTCTPDGTVLPSAPGVSGGSFAGDRYTFVRRSALETISDLRAFAERVHDVNDRLKIVLTVSPVPLAATYTADHVLTATSYSKASLVVAARDVAEAFPWVHYFPSYEIVTNINAGNRYYQPDLRTVTPAGVEHVMRVFAYHHLESDDEVALVPEGNDDFSASHLVCDDDLLLFRL